MFMYVDGSRVVMCMTRAPQIVVEALGVGSGTGTLRAVPHRDVRLYARRLCLGGDSVRRSLPALVALFSGRGAV